MKELIHTKVNKEEVDYIIVNNRKLNKEEIKSLKAIKYNNNKTLEEIIEELRREIIDLKNELDRRDGIIGELNSKLMNIERGLNLR